MPSSPGGDSDMPLRGLVQGNVVRPLSAAEGSLCNNLFPYSSRHRVSMLPIEYQKSNLDVNRRIFYFSRSMLLAP